MFATLIVALLLGYPVAFTLGAIGLVFGLIFLDASFFNLLPMRIYGFMQNFTLSAVPLFVFMGIVLEKSGLAEDLLETMGKLFGSLPGGLAISIVLVGALLAATTGVVGATVVTMGIIALPSMLKNRYSPALATGTIAASGTLGQIIPPSVILILLADAVGVPIGRLFIAAITPGVVLISMYLIYIIIRSWRNPELAPALVESRQKLDMNLLLQLAKSLFPALFLIVAVLGSIFFGIASPTESAAVGAVGAMLLAVMRHSTVMQNLIFSVAMVVGGVIGWIVMQTVFFAIAVAVVGTLILTFAKKITRQHTIESMQHTVRLTSMVFMILIGATTFGLVFRGMGGDHLVHEIFTQLPGGQWGFIIVSLLLIFLLGFFLDFLEICFIVVPILIPIAEHFQVDLLWFAILIAVNLQTSFLTPPFGFSLFYLKAVAPSDMPINVIYRGVIPFVILQVIGLAMMVAFPQMILWLPNYIDTLFGF